MWFFFGGNFRPAIYGNFIPALAVFEELAREARRSEWSGPVYVEGLDTAEKVLGKEVSGAALRYARQRLAMLSELSGYDLGAVLSARFREPLEAGSMPDEDLELPL
ncbi:MAG: hypothetical protein K6U74_05610 [Firmicutes bacterium]|nr:hypothetical protein [Bacillota bacterium]